MKTKRNPTSSAEREGTEGTEMESGRNAGLERRIIHDSNCITKRAVVRQLDDLVIRSVGEERCTCRQ